MGATALIIVRTSYRQVAVSAPAEASKEEVLSSDHANELRTRFNNAITNEIPYDPDPNHPYPDDEQSDES